MRLSDAFLEIKGGFKMELNNLRLQIMGDIMLETGIDAITKSDLIAIVESHFADLERRIDEDE